MLWTEWRDSRMPDKMHVPVGHPKAKWLICDPSQLKQGVGRHTCALRPATGIPRAVDVGNAGCKTIHS